MKAHPGRISYTSYSAGTLSHVAMATTLSLAGWGTSGR
jgi:hypothetical protein